MIEDKIKFIYFLYLGGVKFNNHWWNAVKVHILDYYARNAKIYSALDLLILEKVPKNDRPKD